jgi:signal transduction histidine kinase
MTLARRRRWDWDGITLWVPVVGVAAVTQTKLGLEEPWTGSDAVLTATSLLQATPLVARRRWPVATAALIAAALPIQEALGGALSFGSFVAVLVASYSVGRHATARLAIVGAAITLLGVLLGTRDQLPEDAPDLIFPLFYVSAAASIGAVVKRLSEQSTELQELNAALARERDATARLATVGERMRLSRDLHDSVAHTLTVAVVQAENCEQAIHDDPDAAKSAALAIQEACRHGLSELRSVLRVLRDPDAPAGEPRLADVGALAMVVSESGLDVRVTTRGDLESVPDVIARQLFRVVQESLTNVIKHSAATTANVRVVIAAESAAVSVTDPGPASTSGPSSRGHGTAIMTERLANFGGHVTAGPDGAGYCVHALVPLGVQVGT